MNTTARLEQTERSRAPIFKENGIEVLRVGVFNLVCQIYLLMIIGKMLWEFDIKYVVILAWFFDLFGFIAILMDKKLSKFQLFLHFLDKVLNVSIKILVVIYLEISCCIILFYVPSVQLFIAFLILLNSVVSKKAHKKKHIVIANSYYVLYQIQIILLTLKLNNYLNYSLYQSFVIAWTLLGINCFLIILLLLNLIESCCRNNSGRFSASMIIWLIYYIAGLTISPFMVLIYICDYYDNNTKTSQSSLIMLFLIIIIYKLILAMTTYKLQMRLYYFLRQEILQQTQSPQQNETTINIQSKDEDRVKPDVSKWKKLKLPILFIRVSGTYFKILGKKNKYQQQDQTKNNTLQYQEVNRPESQDQSPCQTILRQCKQSPTNKQQSNETCLICFENEQNVIFVPCHHGGICQQCSDFIMNTTKQCFLCRADIQLAVKTVKNDGILEAINVKRI